MWKQRYQENKWLHITGFAIPVNQQLLAPVHDAIISYVKVQSENIVTKVK